MRGLHAHVGSQILDLEAFESVAEVLGELGDVAAAQPRRRPRHRLHRGGPTRRAIEDYVEALLRHAPDGVTVLCEPGRSLVGNAGVTLYEVGTVKRIPDVRTWVAVNGGMSDNLRPMLYGARYEAQIADRFGGDEVCTVAGMHCESGDVLVRDVPLDSPRPGRPARDARPPAPTATRWPTTTTRCGARRSCSAATATLAWSSAARPSKI